MQDITNRRSFLGTGGAGMAAGAVIGAAAAAALDPAKAYAQAAGGSLLRTVLDRGKLIVGTGSTNAPWHFEDEKGELTGMDITMAKILAKGLFDDENAIEFVRQDPAARIPNIATGKVDITIQFMTVTPGRAQQVAFTRPYYVEGIALLTKPGSPKEKFSALSEGGSGTNVSIDRRRGWPIAGGRAGSGCRRSPLRAPAPGSARQPGRPERPPPRRCG